MKYIDADLLREKISEQMESLPREVGRGAGTITSKGYGMMEAFQIVRSIIDSLQQDLPEVDLEKALNDLDNAYFDLDGIAVVGATHYLTVNDLKDIARYFYELGLKAGEK